MNIKRQENAKNNSIDFIKYLTLKKMNDKIIRMEKSAIDLENEIYSKNNTILTEKEKIYFEINRIYDVLNKKYDLKNLSYINKNLYKNILRLIDNLLKSQENDYTNCDYLKKKILEIQIYLNMKSGLYSVVPSMLKELDDEKGAKVK